MCQHLTDLTESIGGIVDHVMADNPPYPKNWSIPNFSVYCQQRIQIAMRSAKAKLASKAAAWHRTQAGETDVPQTDGGLGGSDTKFIVIIMFTGRRPAIVAFEGK